MNVNVCINENDRDLTGVILLRFECDTTTNWCVSECVLHVIRNKPNTKRNDDVIQAANNYV